MKNSYALLVIVSIAFFQLVDCLNTQADQTQIAETNSVGIYASGKDWSQAPGGGHRISISIHFTFPFTNPAVKLYPSTFTNASGARFINDPSKSWMYFMATNSFCGFVELCDSVGQKLDLIKTEVNRHDSYPATYNLKLARQFLMDKRGSLDGSQLPHPLIGANPSFSFYLKDYFRIRNSGEYQLTVWPIIYKRSATNSDVCERINLTPVKIPIKWKTEN